MLIERVIGTVQIAVDPSFGNRIYFSKDSGISSPSKEISFTALSDLLYQRDKTFRPYVVLWELLGACNFNCPFCYIHTGLNMPNSLWRWESIKQDVDELISTGMLACTLSGGEPLLHPDFPILYRYLKEHGVLVRVFSNLSLLTPQLENLFTELPPFKLEVSLYGSDDKSYCIASGQTLHTFSKLSDSILRLRKKGVNVICKTELNATTISSWRKIEAWCAENSVPYFFSCDLQERYDGSSVCQYVLPDEQQYMVFKETHQSIIPTVSSPKRKELFSCGAGKTGCMIDYKYTVRPCLSLYKTTQLCVQAKPGNLKDAIIEMSHRVDGLRGRKIEACRGCKASCVCEVCAKDALDFTAEANQNLLRKCAKTICYFERLVNESSSMHKQVNSAPDL